MAVTTVGKQSRGSRVRGRLYTQQKKAKRQRTGRVSALLMALGAGFVALTLAPSYIVPLGLMAFFVLIGGAIMDETSTVKSLLGRLLGPILALGGLLLVTFLLVTGAL